MNLDKLQTELGLIVRDDRLSSFLVDWINDALLYMSGNFDFPALQRLEPNHLTATLDAWLYNAPEDYQRGLFLCRDSAGNPVKVCTKFSDLERQDPTHTVEGDHVTHIFADDTGSVKRFAVFPKAAETLDIYYFQRPPVLSKKDEEPYWVPPEYRSMVIVPLVVIRNYKHILSMVENPPDQGLQFWQKEYRKGLFGEPGGDIGMINYLARPIQPRRSGGWDPLP